MVWLVILVALVFVVFALKEDGAKGAAYWVAALVCVCIAPFLK